MKASLALTLISFFLSLRLELNFLIKLNEERGGAVSVTRVVLVDLRAAQRARVVLPVQPAEQAQLAEDVVALVENHRVLIVVVADRTSSAGRLDLLLCWGRAE